MSTVFTDAELAYLASTAHGRLATQQPDGTLQVNPVGFRWNPDTGTIDIGGHGMSRSRKFRNVVDDHGEPGPRDTRCGGVDLRR